MQWSEGGKHPMVRSLGRRQGKRHAAAAGAGHGLLQLRLRRHPILGYTRMHKGMDFRAGYGTPILAATDGRVIGMAGWAGGYGKQVRIAHPGGLMTSYSHMSRIVAAGHDRAAGPGDRLCRLDRPLDRPAPPLRALPQRRADQPGVGEVRDALAAERRDLAAFRAGSRGLLALPRARPMAVRASAAAPKPGFSTS
jgi:hypothetical protein